MYYEYKEFPSIPENLLESPDAVINKSTEGMHSAFKFNPFYQTRNAVPELTEWASQIIKQPFSIKYQIINEGIPIHKDFGRFTALNYILDTGGDNVLTNFYDNNKVLVDSVCFPPKKWHIIRTDMYHNVTNHTHTRVAVTIVLDNYRWGDDWNSIFGPA